MALDQYVNVSSTDSAFFFLLTISGKSGAIRVVNNLEDVVSRGQTFTAYPFSLDLISDDGEKQPEIIITIDNVDRKIVETLREDTSPIAVKLELVVSNALDVVEKTVDFLKLTTVSYDQMIITGTLMPDDILSQGFPGPIYNSAEFPDLVW